MRALVATLLLLSTAAAGCLGGDAPAAEGRSFREAKSWAVEPGGFGEANFELREGDAVSATYASDGGALKWDVHGHDDTGAVRTYDSGFGTSGTITFTAPSNGPFSFYWESPSDNEALILEVTAQGAGAFLGFAP